MTINLNDTCQVTLTTRGVEVIRDYYQRIQMPHLLLRQYPNLKPGMVLETQLWDLFQMFGWSIDLASEQPFDTDIVIVKPA